VVAAGGGERFGQRKQYEIVNGKRVLDWSLGTARAETDGVIAVVPADRAAEPEANADVVVAGGPTRSASVRRGLAAVPGAATHVLVHDAARPVPLPDVWRRVIDALDAGAAAVVPAVPVVDTLREVDGGSVDRHRFLAVQTPQGFRTDVLRAAHRGESDATDDASLVEAMGTPVVIVAGDPANLKITTPLDLIVAGLLCR
jgi:2-C-methyl-D-erythritol 4-phosphate cytidylyltransferase